LGQAPYVLVGICIALLAAVPAFADPSISSKRAEAQQVMGQLQQLSDQLEKARSQYVASTQQLAHIQREEAFNRHELRIAKRSLRISQRVIAQRLVTLYNQGEASTLEVILGAKSLDDMLSRISTAKDVTALDATVQSQLETSRRLVQRNAVELAHAQRQQQQVVAERAAAKRTIETKISQAQSLYNSIKGEIAQLEQQARERQLQAVREEQARAAAAAQAAQAQAATTVVGVSAVTPQNDTVVAPPETHGGVVGIALSQVGVPYVWGGASPAGFDCSGLVMWAYAQIGISLPHSSYAQFGMGVPVSKDALQPGDLVFFDGAGHVGIYIGNGEFVEAPHTGAFVQVSNLNEGWYVSAYTGARRIL
jgi:cell wall-associated NlpC family hydrolase